MISLILDLLRRRILKKNASDIPTGLLPMSDIKSANFVIDVSETGFDLLKEDILAWGRSNDIKTNIYFFDFRKLGQDELLLTSIHTTIIRRELNWIGVPPKDKIAALTDEKSDLFVSLISNGDFPIDYISRCTKARFKIGRTAYNGHPFDLTVSGNSAEDLRSDAREIFEAMTELISKISK